MYIEINNKAQRKSNNFYEYDKRYLSHYFSVHNQFPLFSQVLIETRTDCNKRCSFCPQSFYDKKVEVMKLATYKKIIDALWEIKFAGRIALFVSNEPLLEKRLPKMIHYAKDKSPRFFIDITTNGLLLNLETIDILFKAGLDNININDYRTDRHIYGYRISDNLIPIIDNFRNNPKVHYNARNTNEILPNYAGVIPQKYNVTDYGFCNFPFRKLVFSASGNAMVCCNDFKHITNLGNIETHSLNSIWYADIMNNIRHNLLKDKRISLCSNCNDFQEYSIFKND